MDYIKVKELFKITKGKKVEEIDYKNENSIRYIQIDDLRNNNNIKHCENINKYVIAKKEDIIIAWDGANAGTIGFGIEGAIGSTLAILRKENKEMDTEFCGLFLRSKSAYLREKCTGATIPHIQRTALEDIKIPKIPLNKQIEIKNIINKSQELIDKRKEQIEALDELVKSKFIEMFGDKDKYTYIKIEQLVSNKSDIVDGPFGSNLKTGDYVDDGVRVIQINNIGESNFRDKNKKYITEEKYKSLLKHSVVPGDIVVAKMGEPIGRACILPDYISKAVIVADCMKIRPNLAIINRKYLEFLLNTEEVKAQFRKYSQGSTRVRLNLTMLRQIKVLYPPIELQNQFADFVKQVDKLKFEMENSLKELEDNFNSLMQKAFKGESFNYKS